MSKIGWISVFFALSSLQIQAVEKTPTLGPAEDLVLQDAASVDLLSGLPMVQMDTLRIGNDELALTQTAVSYQGSMYILRDLTNSLVDWIPSAPAGTYRPQVRFGNSSQSFWQQSVGGEYLPLANDGATLTGGPGSYTYTRRDGTTMSLQNGVTTIEYPNGFKLTVRYNSVKSNNGLSFYYTTDVDNSTKQVKGVVAVNNSVESCNEPYESCVLNQSWPKATFTKYKNANAQGELIFEVKDAEGVVTKFVNEDISYPDYAGRTYKSLTKIFESGSTSPTKRYAYYLNRSCAASSAGYFWTCTEPKNVIDYAYINDIRNEYFLELQSGVTGSASARVESALGNMSIAVTNYKGQSSQIVSSTWPDGSAIYDPNNQSRITSVTDKGLQFDFEYDNRGNLKKRTQIYVSNESGKTYSNIVEEASFPASCTNAKTCNKPSWIKDGDGATTYYEYHSQSGYISKVTEPPNEFGIKPVTFYRYTKKYARYIDSSSGQITTSSDGIWLLTEKETCLTSSALSENCQPSDGLIEEYYYGNPSGANNLWLTGVKVSDPDGESRITCFEYDKLGNQIGEISPKAGSAVCY